MTRDLERLTTATFDVVVIGGGIYGACVAWDAVLRGLSVALLEQGDFGHATSANSMKITHGGFRYLQSGDMKRMRESIRERRYLMRNAPHLVRQLPFLLPAYRQGIQRRELLWAALKLYDLIAYDRNRGVDDPGQWVPFSRIISRQECLRLAPGLSERGLTGGAVWHDGQISNTERLTMAVVRSAQDRGACVANYVSVTGLLQHQGRVTGVSAVDRLTGRKLQVRSRLVINTSGPWLHEVLGQVSGLQPGWTVGFTKTVNLVTRPITNHHAVSVVLPHKDGADCFKAGCCRRLHITPWRGHSIAGSLHVQMPRGGDVGPITEGEVSALIADLNSAYPGGALRLSDVRFIHAGLLPREDEVPGKRVSPDHLADHYQIRDHQATDGIDGLLSVVGVKYVTARDVAEKTVSLALQKLGRAPEPPKSSSIPLHGGRIERLESYIAETLQQRPYGLDEDVLRQLVTTYGTDYPAVLASIARDAKDGERLSPSTAVIRAQVRYAVREEMAWTLRDVVFRRIELGSAEYPGRAALRQCADVMAEELGWDAMRLSREVDEVEQVFVAMHVPVAPRASAPDGTAT